MAALSEDVKEKVVNALWESKYGVHATGFRDIRKDELRKLVNILRSNDCDFKSRLDELYKYHPDTIELDRKNMELDCDSYNPECDCFLPDISPDNCWCKRKRKEKIESKDARNYPEYQEWRNSVFKRDDFTCQNCGNKGGELNAHHIKSYAKYPDLRLKVSNGVTLCKECHLVAHEKQ